MMMVILAAIPYHLYGRGLKYVNFYELSMTTKVSQNPSTWGPQRKSRLHSSERMSAP